jgi:hypothetical protein
VDLGERQGPEEAELGDVKGPVAVAVGDGRVTAAAEVTGPQELWGDPGGAPALAAVGGAHDRHAAADVVVGGGHGDQRVAGVVGDRGLVLGQRGLESSFICTLASAGAAAVPLARRCLARAATAAGLTIARTPLEMPPENRWVWSTQRGVGWLAAAPEGAAIASMAATVARMSRMTRVRFTDTLLEPERTARSRWVGGARAPVFPVPHGLSRGLFPRTPTARPLRRCSVAVDHPRRFNRRRTD